MRKLMIGLVLLFSLTACGSHVTLPPTKGGPFQTPTPLTTPLPSPVVGAETPISELVEAPGESEETLDMGELPDGETLRQLLLFSHTHWRRFWGDGWMVRYAGDGSTEPLQVTRTQIWLEQPAKARVVSGTQSEPRSLWVSDGAGFSADQGPVQELPPYIKQTFNPPTILTDTIQPYPLAGMLGTSLSDMLFPTTLAQRGGEFQVIGKEELAGRTAIVALWSFQPGGPVVDRMWIDAKSGILLRWINYSKPGGSFISSEMYFSGLQIDQVLPELAFAVGSPLPLAYATDAQDLPLP